MLDTGSCLPSHALKQCFSSFLMRRPFNTFPHVVGTPTIQLFLLLLHNCHFANVMKNNVNIWYATPKKWSVKPPRGCNPHVGNHCFKLIYGCTACFVSGGCCGDILHCSPGTITCKHWVGDWGWEVGRWLSEPQLLAQWNGKHADKKCTSGPEVCCQLCSANSLLCSEPVSSRLCRHYKLQCGLPLQIHPCALTDNQQWTRRWDQNWKSSDLHWNCISVTR